MPRNQILLCRGAANLTGFALFEYGFGAKWLELLKQIVPSVRRVAILRDSTNPAGIGHLAAIQAVAPLFGVELTLIDARDPAEIERAVTAFARGPNGGLINTTTVLTQVRYQLIITLAGRYGLPAIYPYRSFVADGGLMCYGPDVVDPFRRAASYVDRILKGEKPTDLPVQNPTKYELVINLNAAKAIGLTVPPTLFALATEVIQ